MKPVRAGRLRISAGKMIYNDKLLWWEHEEMFILDHDHIHPETWQLTFWKWYVCVFRA